MQDTIVIVSDTKVCHSERVVFAKVMSRGCEYTTKSSYRLAGQPLNIRVTLHSDIISMLVYNIVNIIFYNFLREYCVNIHVFVRILYYEST